MASKSTERKSGAAKYSILVNAALVIMKIIAGTLSGSLGVLAEALHSVLDLFASVFAYLGIRKAGEKADKTHHYGHDRFENLSSLVQMALIAITALVIIYEAIGRLQHPQPIKLEELGIFVIAIAMVADYWISNYLKKESAGTGGSPALEADAYHFETDLWSSAAVIAGLVISKLGGIAAADSVAALAVAVMMLKLSYTSGKKSTMILLDQSPSEEIMKKIERILRSTRGVKGFHKFRARIAGSRILVDVNVHLPGSFSLKKAHHISEEMERKLKKEVPEVKEVVVHMEPEGHKS